MKDPCAIELRDVTVVYNENTPNEVVALRGVSLQVARGEVLLVKGGNGSGKSTVLKAIAGTAPVKSGKVLIDGIDVTGWPAHRRTKYLGFVHQDPLLGTCPNLTVYENFLISNSDKWWHPIPFNGRQNTHFETLLSNLSSDLSKKLLMQVSMLSGGQRQAIAVCMALANLRGILLLDEITVALDEGIKKRVYKIVHEVIEENGITTFIISHDTDWLTNHAFNLRYIQVNTGILV